MFIFIIVVITETPTVRTVYCGPAMCRTLRVGHLTDPSQAYSRRWAVSRPLSPAEEAKAQKDGLCIEGVGVPASGLCLWHVPQAPRPQSLGCAHSGLSGLVYEGTGRRYDNAGAGALDRSQSCFLTQAGRLGS